MMLMSSVDTAVYLRVRRHVERTEEKVFERDEWGVDEGEKLARCHGNNG